MESNPNRFTEEVIKKFVRTSPFKRLDALGGDPILEIPLIGFVEGNDPLFAEYKKVVHKRGLCQTGVPCESRIPIAPEQKEA